MIVCILLGTILSGCQDPSPKLDVNQVRQSLDAYHEQLNTFRAEFREAEQPDIRFFLFGMGNRCKLLYKNGQVIHALTGAIVENWDIVEEVIVPNEYAVLLQTRDGKSVAIFENENAVWIQSDNKTTRICGTEKPIHLPDFEDFRFSEILKVLHHELLINVIESKPVPNYFVYQKPWRRDAAMMAMCLQKTGNVDLIKDWVLSIDDPYDHNNGQGQGKPEDEADNLGQTLYLLSFFSDSTHPVVSKIRSEATRFEIQDEHGRYIRGRSDFQEVPVYQTKFLKYGLAALGMKDPYTIPNIPCNYSSLYWWGYKANHVHQEYGFSDYYPYIGWARDHFNGEKNNPVSNRDYPLTWETRASEADYPGMAVIDSIFVEQKTCSPHTWHAAEIFLYLLDSQG